jgi:hypothetical protein
MFATPNALINCVEGAGQGNALLETRRSGSRLVPFEHVLRRSTTMLRVIALAAWPTFSLTAYAHDQWRNGEPVPSWVKVVCCGRTDAHHLRPEEVRRTAAGDYVVDIYPWPIAAQLALPSQDGDCWLFFYEDNGVYGRIGCFFVPVLFQQVGLSPRTGFAIETEAVGRLF